MKASNIARVIKEKIADWAKTVDNAGVREIIETKTIVTGGAIASMLLGEKINGYDCYFRSRGATAAVASYYVDKFNDLATTTDGPAGVILPTVNILDDRIQVMIKPAGAVGIGGGRYRYFEGEPEDDASAYIQELYSVAREKARKSDEQPYIPVYLTGNAISLSGKVQVITRFFGEPEQIHSNYDFVHCTNHWTAWDGLHLRQDALEALLAKELRYIGSRYPLCSVMRIRKFLKRGFYITAGQILKMLWQVSELDLRDFSVLEDQLTGVDTAYFSELLEKLREANPEKVDKAYLMTLTDKIV